MTAGSRQGRFVIVNRYAGRQGASDEELAAVAESSIDFGEPAVEFGRARLTEIFGKQMEVASPTPYQML